VVAPSGNRSGQPPSFHGVNDITPRTREVTLGTKKILLVCASTGVPFPTVTWLHNNHSLSSDSNKYSIMNINFTGTLFSQLIINDIQESDLGEYRCTSTNLAGSMSIVISDLIRSSRKKRSVELSPSASICPKKSADTGKYSASHCCFILTPSYFKNILFILCFLSCSYYPGQNETNVEIWSIASVQSSLEASLHICVPI